LTFSDAGDRQRVDSLVMPASKTYTNSEVVSVAMRSALPRITDLTSFVQNHLG